MVATAAVMGVPRSAPTVNGPKLEPRKKLKPSKVYLEDEIWKELDEAALFQTIAFELMGEAEKVSRNDVIIAFARWALDNYWADKGGRPTSTDDRLKKARKYVEALKKQQAAAQK